MRFRCLSVVVLAITAAMIGNTQSIFAQTRSWTGAFGVNAVWENPVNWNPLGFPLTNDSVFIGNLVSDAEVYHGSNATVRGLTLSNSAYLGNNHLAFTFLADDYDDTGNLIVTGNTTLLGNSFLELPIKTNNLTLGGNSKYSNNFTEPLIVDNLATIGSSATVQLSDDFILHRDGNTALVNDGTIELLSNHATIDTTKGALLDLDGTAGTGRIEIGDNSLTVNGAHDGEFNGTINIGGPEFGGWLTMSDDWTAGSSSIVNVSGIIQGGEFTTSGTINVSQWVELRAAARMQQANVTGAGELHISDLVVENGLTEIAMPLVMSIDLATADDVSLRVAEGGNLRLADRFEAKGGTVSNPGTATLVVEQGSSLSIGGEAQLERLDARIDGALSFQGPADFTFPQIGNNFHGTGRLLFGDVANFNSASATIDVGSIMVSTGGDVNFLGTDVKTDDLRVWAGIVAPMHSPSIARVQIGRTDSVSTFNTFEVRNSLLIGNDSGGISEVLVAGPHLTEGEPTLDVGGSVVIGMGQPSTGLLTVTNGALAHVGGDVQIGGQACCGGTNDFTGTGHVYVTGTSNNGRESTLDTDGTIKVGLSNIGGASALNLEPGGRVAADTLKLWNVGNVFMTGGTLDLVNFDKESAGNFTHTGGVANIVGGTGTFNSSHSYGGALQGMPEMNILEGADVAVTYSFNMAPSAGQHARAVVRGTNAAGNAPSTLRGTGGGGGADLNIGTRGIADLAVLDGGRVALNDDVVLGSEDGSFGQLAIVGVQNGHRSRVEALRGTGSNFFIGGQHGAGDGFLYVAGGGLATTSADVIIARSAGSTGTVIVEREEAGTLAELIAADDIFVGGTSTTGGLGTIDINAGGRVEADRMLLHLGSSVNLAGGTLKLNELYFESFGGTVTVTEDSSYEVDLTKGDVDFVSGSLRPGDSPGNMTFQGNLNLASATTLEIELGSTSDFDTVFVDGIATLAGTLDLVLYDLGGGIYEPALGDAFEILSSTVGIQGTFNTLTMPTLPNDLGWDLAYNQLSVELSVVDRFERSDFNEDGSVDISDLTLWESAYGGLGADSDDDGDTDGFDFLAWQNGFAGNSGNQASAFAATAVPEPASMLLLLIGLVGTLVSVRR